MWSNSWKSLTNRQLTSPSLELYKRKWLAFFRSKNAWFYFLIQRQVNFSISFLVKMRKVLCCLRRWSSRKKKILKSFKRTWLETRKSWSLRRTSWRDWKTILSWMLTCAIYCSLGAKWYASPKTWVFRISLRHNSAQFSLMTVILTLFLSLWTNQIISDHWDLSKVSLWLQWSGRTEMWWAYSSFLTISTVVWHSTQ